MYVGFSLVSAAECLAEEGEFVKTLVLQYRLQEAHM